MDKYKNKYRISSTRAKWWDYSSNAAYFVTICTKDKEHYFGSIANGIMQLSAMGHIANSCWHQIPNHFPFVLLGAHIIMPDHVHGIVIINKPDHGSKNTIETQDLASPLNPKPKNKFGPQSQNLASIIRGFKVGVTKNARQINPEFSWQSRFHDSIIRDHISYERVSKYIIDNPSKWGVKKKGK